jgi:hypothetical protein
VKMFRTRSRVLGRYKPEHEDEYDDEDDFQWTVPCVKAGIQIAVAAS